jgi:hypothetical protein
MSNEKIGSSVLGYGSSLPTMSPKKRKELELKVKAELAKQKQKENAVKNEEKLPDLPIPNDQHDPKLGEHGWDQIDDGVHVNEHYRKKPKKNEK